MKDFERFAEALQTYVRPGTFPVAVRMIKEGEELPERVKRPWEDMEIRIAMCQGIAMARRYGWVVAMGRDDLSCPLTKAVFGFEPKLDYFEEGHACAGMFTDSAEAGAHTEAEVARFEYGQYEAVLAAPFHRTAFKPHLAVIYGNSAQVMRLLVASLYQRGGRIASSFCGRIDCSDSIIVPIHSGTPQVILPCYGDRFFAQTEDHEMAYAVPSSWFAEVAQGLEGTQKGGIRYPTPKFLQYTGIYPEHYMTMETLWRGLSDKDS